MDERNLEETLSPYAGRWVALVGNQVAGVGESGEAAILAAQRSRPRERFVLRFVELAGGEPLTLAPLLARLRPFFHRQSLPIYLVGGAVRDAILGLASPDLDFVLPKRAIKMSYKLADQLGVPAYVLDKERDTGRVMLPKQQTSLDLARFRGATLADDLRDRDFTINAIALPATATTTASLIDPCGGINDLAQKKIRLTHEQAIQQDPVRGLRAVRLAGKLGFTIADETKAIIERDAALITAVSPERVRDELCKLLCTASPAEGVSLLHALRLLDATLPEVAALDGVEQSAPHHEPVLAHTLSTLRWLTMVEKWCVGQQPDNETVRPIAALLSRFGAAWSARWEHVVAGEVNGRLLLRLGALLHDVGKRETQSQQTNRRGQQVIRFLGHEGAGATLAKIIGERLVLSKAAVSHLQQLVAGHMRPLLLANEPKRPSRRAIFRFFRDTQGTGLDILLLSLADHLAIYRGVGDLESWERLTAVIETMLTHYFEHHTETVAPPPLVDGNQLMKALAMKPGREIGRLLSLIQEAQAAGDISTREEAITLAKEKALRS